MLAAMRRASLTHRGRQVQLRASAKGWAQMYLKAEPYNYRRRQTKHDYEHAALKQGHIAVNSILRDPSRIAIVQEAVAFVLGCYDVSVFGEGELSAASGARAVRLHLQVASPPRNRLFSISCPRDGAEVSTIRFLLAASMPIGGLHSLNFFFRS